MSNLTNNTNKFHLILQTNSPGELAAWVQPIAVLAKQHDPSCVITLCLVPCQYASGQETAAAAAICEIDHVLTPTQTLAFLVGFKSLPFQSTQGAVLCLGGDPMYAQLLGWRTGFYSSIYTEQRKKPGLFFKHVFYKHQHGDLMAAHVRLFTRTKSDVLAQYNLPDQPYLLFFLGSRPSHFKAFSALFLQMLPFLLQQLPDLHILLPLAPTLPVHVVEQFKQRCQFDRVHICQGHSLDFMAVSRAMVSLPGTNTAEAMYMHLPMLTVVPLNRPDLMVVDGVLGLVGKLPVVGRLIMKLVIRVLSRQIKFVSLPNKIAQKMIVPQYIKFIIPKDWASVIIDFYCDTANLSTIKQQLTDIAHDQQTDQAIIAKLLG